MVEVDLEELREERRKNREDMLKHIDWIVEQIKKDHRRWLRMQVEWLRRSRKAQLATLGKLGFSKKDILEIIEGEEKIRGKMRGEK